MDRYHNIFALGGTTQDPSAIINGDSSQGAFSAALGSYNRFQDFKDETSKAGNNIDAGSNDDLMSLYSQNPYYDKASYDWGTLATQGLNSTLKTTSLGASVGGAIAPGVGTAIGAGIGAGVGLWGTLANGVVSAFTTPYYNRLAENANQRINRGLSTAASNIDKNAYYAAQANSAANGGQIHIKAGNRGKFTAAAKAAGMSVQEFAKHVLSNRERYSPTQVKRANFARNASKWHADGGQLTTDFPIPLYEYPNGGQVYTVKKGDTLSSIAQDLYGDANRYTSLAALNNIQNPNRIQIGDQIQYNVPQETTPAAQEEQSPFQATALNQLQDFRPQAKSSILTEKIPETISYDSYTVRKGDTLGKIAKQTSTPLRTLQELNHITNPNKINVGQQLKLMSQKQESPQETKSPLPTRSKTASLMEVDAFKADEDKLNSTLSDSDIINYYYSRGDNSDFYLVDNKPGDCVELRQGGKIIATYPAVHSKNKGSDEMTKTYTDASGKLKDSQGNMSTPAGVYIAVKGADYHGAPSFQRFTEDQYNRKSKDSTPSSIHVGNTIEKWLGSNGCTRLSANSLRDLDRRLGKQAATYCYNLPVNKEEKNGHTNRFKLRNGEIQFESRDIHETPARNTMNYNPIEKIEYDSENLPRGANPEILNQFLDTLKTSKGDLQKDLKINNDTYNTLVKQAFGILGAETTFGNTNWGLENMVRAGLKKLSGGKQGGPDYKSEYDTYNLKSDNNSIGLTQIRMSQLSDSSKKLFKKYGITKDELVNNPGAAAIATMIKLSDEYKNQGHNFDKTVQAWNSKPAYLNQVKDFEKLIKIYQYY